jgi:DNA repair protein RadC
MPNYVTLKNRSKDERPREKLLQHGKHTLSNAELLGILISTGSRERSAIDLARDILKEANNNLNHLARFSVSDLCKIPGIGTAKAVTILSAIEIGGRRNAEDVVQLKKVNSSTQAYRYIAHKLCDKKHEEFWVILLNRANQIISDVRVSQGGISYTAVDPKLVFKHAIDYGASALIACHNHPSGSLTPSESDNDLTRKLVLAGKILDINVLDHLIITAEDYFSYADHDLLPSAEAKLS